VLFPTVYGQQDRAIRYLQFVKLELVLQEIGKFRCAGPRAAGGLDPQCFMKVFRCSVL
jgi:hypothetical protein